jgi:hypothetical protein
MKVLVPDYVVDGLLFLQRHYEGGFIFRELILIEAFPDGTVPAGWRMKYGYQTVNPGKPGLDAQASPLIAGQPNVGVAFNIPIEQKARPGLRGTLRVEARPWT